MNQREINRQARVACGAMIDANIGAGDGDLWIGVDGWSDEDRERFSEACQRIADRFGCCRDRVADLRKQVPRSDFYPPQFPIWSSRGDPKCQVLVTLF